MRSRRARGVEDVGARDRTSIIEAVRTPLGFFTLAVLIAEVCLVLLIPRVEGPNLTIIVVGVVLLPFVLVAAVTWQYPKTAGALAEKDRDTRKRKYDVFVASVLAGFEDDARLAAERKTALAVVRALEQECRFSVYYAGRDVESKKDFDGSEIGAREDIEALRDSRHFIMIYPERLTSSVLFEAGYAYQRCETSTYFVRRTDDLPYLMRRLPEVHSTFLRTLHYETADDIVRVIKTRRKELFSFPNN
jgi:hypothetical protein